MSRDPDILLNVKNLTKHFPIRRGFFRRTVGQVQAVSDVSFDVHRGETLGIVGESGSGKTTLGRCLVRLAEPTSGAVELHDPARAAVDVARLRGKELKALRRDFQIIFQDPRASLNARMSIGDIITEPMAIHGIGSRRERMARAGELLELVGMGGDDRLRYPHEFSGGQRQRIGIARALCLNPRLVICDEPVSALDVSVQAQVLNLLKRLQRELGLTYVFITHDLAVASYMCDRILVMYLGRIVELAPNDTLYRRPRHPYSSALLSAIPAIDDAPLQRQILHGQIPSPANPPPGCHFHTRCPFALERCRVEVPSLAFPLDRGSLVACHRANELELAGVTAGAP